MKKHPSKENRIARNDSGNLATDTTVATTNTTTITATPTEENPVVTKSEEADNTGLLGPVKTIVGSVVEDTEKLINSTTKDWKDWSKQDTQAKISSLAAPPESFDTASPWTIAGVILGGLGGLYYAKKHGANWYLYFFWVFIFAAAFGNLGSLVGKRVLTIK